MWGSLLAWEWPGHSTSVGRLINLEVPLIRQSCLEMKQRLFSKRGVRGVAVHGPRESSPLQDADILIQSIRGRSIRCHMSHLQMCSSDQAACTDVRAWGWTTSYVCSQVMLKQRSCIVARDIGTLDARNSGYELPFGTLYRKDC
jgi:hypothetical protein